MKQDMDAVPTFLRSPENRRVIVDARIIAKGSTNRAATAPVQDDEPMLTADEEAELVERINANPNLQQVQDDDAGLVRLLRLFEDAYSSSRGMPWIGTVRPEQAFARAADRIERLQAALDNMTRVMVEAGARKAATPPADHSLVEALSDLRLQALQSELNDPANEYGYAALQKANNALAALAGKQSADER
jgi:hypothetical protein